MTRTFSSSNLAVPAPLGFLVRQVLVTGMSGVGKSSALAALARRGFELVDTDEPGWTAWSDEERPSSVP
jgi:predicted ATPase